MLKIIRKKKFICIKDGLTDVAVGDIVKITEIAYMSEYGIQIDNSYWVNSETLGNYFKNYKKPKGKKNES